MTLLNEHLDELIEQVPSDDRPRQIKRLLADGYKAEALRDALALHKHYSDRVDIYRSLLSFAGAVLHELTKEINGGA